MKTWWNFQVGTPQAQHAVTGQVSANARFSGNAALNINASYARLNAGASSFIGAGAFSNIGVIRSPAFAAFAGVSTLSAVYQSGTRAQAVATFAGGATLFANATQTFRLAAIANIAGAGALTATPFSGKFVFASFASVSTFSANTAGVFRTAVASFATAGALFGIATLRGRLQAIATFSGIGSTSLTTRQKYQAISRFAGSAALGLTPQMKLSAGNTKFAGAGVSSAMGTISNPSGAVPSPPVFVGIASTAADQTPDLIIDLPVGLGDSTDAVVNDVLIVEVSADGGLNWSIYCSHILVPSDFSTGSSVATGTILAPGTYQFRARFRRDANFSAYSAIVNGTIVVPPGAPSFIIISVAPDNTPDFSVIQPGDAAVGDVLVFQSSINNGTTWLAYFTHTLILADLTSCTVAGQALSAGTYLFRSRLERSTIPSAWSGTGSWIISTGSTTPTAMFLRTLADKNESDDPYTKLLLHMDGTNLSRVFVDSSPSNHPLGANGNYQQTTGNFKFGTASGTYTGNAADAVYVNEVSPSADFAFGTGDFTIDLWFYQTSGNLVGVFYDNRTQANDMAYPAFMVSETNILRYWVNYSIVIDGTTPITLNTWHHAALARSGTSTRMFLDGIQQGPTYNDTNNYLNTGAFRPMIGNDGFVFTNPFLGALDEVRVSKGIARWTGNFTPPTVPYSVTSNPNNARLRAQIEKGGGAPPPPPPPPPLVIAPTTLPNGVINVAYNPITITASGGTGPYTFTYTGTLPNGLTLTSGGLLSGTPTVSSTFNFTVRVTDSLNATATQAYSITIPVTGGNIATYHVEGYTGGVGPTNTLAPYFPINETFTGTIVLDLNAVTFDPQPLQNHIAGVLSMDFSMRNGTINFGMRPDTPGVLLMGVDTAHHWCIFDTSNYAPPLGTFDIYGPVILGQPMTQIAVLLRDDTMTAVTNGDMPASIDLSKWAPFEPPLRKLNFFYGQLGEVISPFTVFTRIS